MKSVAEGESWRGVRERMSCVRAEAGRSDKALSQVMQSGDLHATICQHN